jgi:uncharacterized protein (DUF1330 family)
MAAYIIANVSIRDQDRYDEYRRQVPAVIEKYGGRYLVRGGACWVLEGEHQPHRLVIIEFESQAAARQFYESPEYQPLKRLRQDVADSSIVLVEGVQDTAA